MKLLVNTLDVLGKIMIAYTALRVHHSVLTEKKVDKQVLLEMRQEQIIGILGVVFIMLAYIIEVVKLNL